MEVPGLNSGKFFDIVCAPFYPHGDCSIRVSRSHDFTLNGFYFYDFIAVTLLLFKLSKSTAMMISLCTNQFSSYSHTWFIL